jgi:hypothetical protein
MMQTMRNLTKPISILTAILMVAGTLWGIVSTYQQAVTP